MPAKTSRWLKALQDAPAPPIAVARPNKSPKGKAEQRRWAAQELRASWERWVEGSRPRAIATSNALARDPLAHMGRVIGQEPPTAIPSKLLRRPSPSLGLRPWRLGPSGGDGRRRSVLQSLEPDRGLANRLHHKTKPRAHSDDLAGTVGLLTS